MGVLFMYKGDFTNKGEINERECTLELCDNHGVPELIVGPLHNSHLGYIIPFTSWNDYEEFVQQVITLHNRLKELHS